MIEEIAGDLLPYVATLLLALLAWIGNRLTSELSELRETVNDHGNQLASINTTLKHLDRRRDFPEK